MRQTDRDGWGQTADRIGPVPPTTPTVQTLALTRVQQEADADTLAYALGLLCPVDHHA